jgi:hypothetical protein
MQYERDMISSIEGGQVPLNQATIDKYFAEARAMVRNWGTNLHGLAPTKPGWFFSRYWRHYNKLNGIE